MEALRRYICHFRWVFCFQSCWCKLLCILIDHLRNETKFERFMVSFTFPINYETLSSPTQISTKKVLRKCSRIFNQSFFLSAMKCAGRKWVERQKPWFHIQLTVFCELITKQFLNFSSEVAACRSPEKHLSRKLYNLCWVGILSYGPTAL